MALAIFSVMIVLLLLGFPMMIPLIAGSLIGFVSLFGGVGQLDTMVQQILGGIQPASLIAVPMFSFIMIALGWRWVFFVAGGLGRGPHRSCNIPKRGLLQTVTRIRTAALAG